MTKSKLVHDNNYSSHESLKRHRFSLEDVLQALGTHRKQFAIMFISAIGYGHFAVQSMMPTLATQSLWDCWPYLEHQPMVFNAVFAVGGFARLIGSLFLLPWLDVMGRLYFVFGCMLLSLLTSCLSCACPVFWLFVIFRGLTLMLTSVLPSSSVVYSLEMVMTKRRSMPATLCQVTGVVGVLFGIFIASGFEAASHGNGRAWRWAILVSNIPTVIAVSIMGWLWLETPRFQAANRGDIQGAWTTFQRLTPHNSRSELYQSLNIDEQTPFPPTESFEGIDESKIPPPRGVTGHLKDLLGFISTTQYRRTTCGLSLLWILQTFAHWGMVSYIGVFYDKIGVNKTWTSAGSYIVQLPGNLVLYYIMQWHHGGRLRGIMLFAGMSGVCQAVMAVSLAATDVKWLQSQGWLVFLSMMGYFFGSPVWGAIYAISAESYLTINRGLAMAFFGCLAALSTICTTYVSAASLNDQAAWLAPAIWSCLRFATALAAFVPPTETARSALGDVVKD